MKKRLLNFPTTLQFKALFEKEEDFKKVKGLTKRQNSAIRAAYLSQKEICRCIKEAYKLPSWYIFCATRALPMDKRVIFGGKRSFEKLKKKRLQDKRREEIERQWREKRQENLISLGSEAKEHKDNPCIRPEDKKGAPYLRITTGERGFVYAKVKRGPSNERGQWLTFLSMLIESWKSQKRSPYTAELKLKEGEAYGFVSFDHPSPEVEITKRHRVIAIDTDASPLCLALAELSTDGNLVNYQRISLHNFWQYSTSRREHEGWLIAHHVVDFAYSKAIAMEDLKSFRNGCRGDGKAKLRKRLHRWRFKRPIQKIERVARLREIELIKVHPAHTSIIGMPKYTPQLVIDKGVAGAHVIGRKVSGFKEDTSKNYEKFLEDKGFLRSALGIYKQEEQRLSGFLDKGTKEYKKNTLEDGPSKVQSTIELIEKGLRKKERKNKRQSLQSEPMTSSGPMEGNSWSILKLVLLATVLGEAFLRGFSSLRGLLISKKGQDQLPLALGGVAPCGMINWTKL